MIRKIVFFVLFLLIDAKTTVAGIVNSPQSFPFSAMNQSEDFILIGDWRFMVYWEGRFHAVVQDAGIPSRATFTGGIAERSDAEVTAILCDGKNAYLFFPARTASSPSGRLELIYSRADRRHEIRCSMDRDGNWSILDLGDKLLITRQFGKQSMDQNFRNAWLSYAEEVLLILTDGNQLIQQSAMDGSFHVQKSPFSAFSSESRLLSKAGFMLYRNDYHLQIARYQPHPNGVTIEGIERLPISPCNDEQICSMSLAHDGSWLYLGYWGTYFGKAQQYERLPTLLETGKTAGTAISHSGFNGKFIFTGPYDGDWGQVQKLKQGYDTKSHFSPWEPVFKPTLDLRQESFAWMSAIRLPEARSLLAASGIQAYDVAMGVVDSGIGSQSGRLQLKFMLKDQEWSNGEDSDGNGYIDDAYGFDFIRETASLQDSFGHGSHVSGLLASQLDEEPFAPASNGRLIVARALDQSGKSNALDLARAIYYTVDEGAKVLNLSWGGGRPSFALQDALQYAKQRGVTIFTSAGNDRLNHDEQPQVPAIYPGVISVGAVNQRGQAANYSNFGAQTVSFLAPGSDVISSLKDGKLGPMTGTSMASPIVASSFAWLLGISQSLYPQLSDSERVDLVLEALCQTAQAVGKASRCGLIQLDAALRYLLVLNND